MSDIELMFHIVAAVGSILSGIIMLITFIQVITRLKLKNEVIYGQEAEDQYKTFTDKELKNCKKIPSYKYEGGMNKIVPRLEIEKFVFNPMIMKRKYRIYKRKVRYFDKDRNVTTWYLKWTIWTIFLYNIIRETNPN